MKGIAIISAVLLVLMMTSNPLAFRYANRVLRIESRAVKDDMEAMEQKCEFGICASPKDYPKDKIVELLERTKDVHQSFFGDIIEPSDKMDASVGNRASFGRFGDTSETLCQSQRRTVKPRLQRDINNKMKYVVNFGDFEQIVTFETCMRKPCFGSELLLNYTTECVQKYNVIKLLAVSESGDSLEYGRFLIPSTCVCAYSR